MENKSIEEIANSQKNFLSTKEVAAVLGISPLTFRRRWEEYAEFFPIWTTISEWSRDKKIRKELVGGKPEIIVTPESEWEKIKPQDREYAKRLLEEQVQLKEEQLSKNKFMQKLCELKSNAESELKAKKAQAEEIKQKKADFKNSKNNRKDGVNNA